MKHNLFVVSLGGSLVAPDKIDVIYLEKFRRLIWEWAREGRKFFIIVGGGRTARDYQNAARTLGVENEEVLDWMGIKATYLNAEIVKDMLGAWAYKKVVLDYEKMIKPNGCPIVVAAGWEPGHSTDYNAVYLASKYGAKEVINLSNVKFLYDKDPQKFKNAQPILKTSYDELLKITGNTWTPGANVPFDPIAAKLARRNKIKIYITDGKDLENLNNIIKRSPFSGTIIE